MRVLDLFAGLRGWSDPFADRGHETFTVDLAERFDVDLHADVETLTAADLPWRPDVILASPPCEAFSVLTIGRNWTIDHRPKTPKAETAIRLVEATIRLIDELEPRWWIIENPRGKLRRLAPVDFLERVTVTYCAYGGEYMKPTDLWGGFPDSWRPRPQCRAGSPCHAAAPRGSRTGVQGGTKFRGGMMTAGAASGSRSRARADWTAEIAKIPRELAIDLCRAMEREAT